MFKYVYSFTYLLNIIYLFDFFFHIKNVYFQVQFPGSSQSISLSLPSAVGAALASSNSQQTGLLVSVPVTSTTQVNTMQAIPSVIPTCNVLGSNTQTVVLTNSQSGAAGSMLTFGM